MHSAWVGSTGFCSRVHDWTVRLNRNPHGWVLPRLYEPMASKVRAHPRLNRISLIFREHLRWQSPPQSIQTPVWLSKSSTLPRRDHVPPSDPFVRSLGEVFDQGERTGLVLVGGNGSDGDGTVFGGESVGTKTKTTEQSDGIPRRRSPSGLPVSVSRRRLRNRRWVLKWECQEACYRKHAWTLMRNSYQRFGRSKCEGSAHLSLSCPRTAYASLIARNFP